MEGGAHDESERHGRPIVAVELELLVHIRLLRAHRAAGSIDHMLTVLKDCKLR